MEEDRLAMFKRVCACEYEMPQGLSRELKDLVARLLVRNPASRLGAGPAGAADVRNHRWFHGFDWAAFRAKTMPAPYVPRIKSPEEAAANFKPVKEPAHFAAYRQKHYVSQGHFKDF